MNNIKELAVSVVVGLGSAAITGGIMLVRVEERVAHIERVSTRHETMISETNRRDSDQERRLVKGESLIESMRGDLSEIKADVKTLIRGSVRK